jgi:uncharacterized protein YndB with AHSA1/START domain
MHALVDIEETIHVDATPDAVWQLISDVRRHPEYAGPKSITKVIDFDDTLHVGARWIAHEKFGPQKFDAPSEVTTWDPDHTFGWVSFLPMKEANRGEGGRVFWSYTVTPELDGTRLTHHMEVLPPAKGAWTLKTMYAVLRLPAKQRRGIRTTLANIKSTAEHD